MKYVDDLSKVRPEEIEHPLCGDVISITVLPDEAVDSVSKVVVCFRDNYGAYTLDGRVRPDRNQVFTYKPNRVVYMKSMKQLLSECSDYEFLQNGDLFVTINECNVFLPTYLFRRLGKPNTMKPTKWDNIILEVREIEEE